MKYEIFEEAGKSASYETINNRPVLQRLMALIEQDKVKNLYCTELDRLSRNPISQQYVKARLKEHSVILYTVGQSYDFKQSITDDFLSDILVSVGKLENATRVQRIQRAKLESLKQGGYKGGLCAFGYKSENGKIVIDADESKTYLQIIDWFVNGTSIMEIVRRLNEQGIKTRFNKNLKKDKIVYTRFGKQFEKSKSSYYWTRASIHKILKNKIYTGTAKYAGMQYKVPILIDDEIYNKIQWRLKENKEKSRRNNKVNFYLLKGLLVCNRCKQRIYGFVRKPKQPNYSPTKSYICHSKWSQSNMKSCGLKNIPIDWLNDKVWSIFLEILFEESEVRFKDTTDDLKKLESESKYLAKKQEELKEESSRLIKLYVNGKITDNQFNEINNENKEKQTSIETELNLTYSKIANFKDIQKIKQKINLPTEYQRLLKIPDEEKRDLLDKMLQAVYIDFDEKKKDHKLEMEFKIQDLRTFKFTL